MSAELHLPDLPEVEVTVGHGPGNPKPPHLAWPERLRNLLSTLLPLLTMAMVAVGSWWLVKISPKETSSPAEQATRHDPDYRLEKFSMERFDASGRMTLRIEGERLRHYPDTDTLEIDRVHIHAEGDNGQVIQATAHEAVASGDGSRVTLLGGAYLQSTAPGMPPVEFRSEKVVALVKERIVSTDSLVTVRQGRSEFQAHSLRYDANTRQLTLQGPARVVLTPTFNR